MSDQVSSAVPTLGRPVEVSAQGLHELAVQAFRFGNRGRLSLCEALRGLSETRLFLDLGFPSLAAYAGAFFQLHRSESFEYVRVAHALIELTELRGAFAQGRLGWSALKAISRVAAVETQASWIDFVGKHGVERTLAEARDALKRGRDTPRDSPFGLPNLDQKLVLRFSRSDMEKVRGWLERSCAAVAESTGAKDVTLEQALLFLCEQDAVTGVSASPRAQVLYQCCPDCSKARVGTRDGFVEVSSEEVERYEGCAELTAVDGPTPPQLRRQIMAREAGRCGNPRCHHPADHCHHIVFRSRGGKTELANEVAVCTTCHALIHAGLLRVSGDPNVELCWSPVAGEVDSAGAEADRFAVLHVVTGSSSREARPSEVPPESVFADSVVEDLAGGLMRLGVPAARSRHLIAAAIEALPRDELTESDVLRAAIASI